MEGAGGEFPSFYMLKIPCDVHPLQKSSLTSNGRDKTLYFSTYRESVRVTLPRSLANNSSPSLTFGSYSKEEGLGMCEEKLRKMKKIELNT